MEVTPGMRLIKPDGGDVGQVIEVVVSPESGAASHVVVALAGRGGEPRVMPSNWIQRVNGDIAELTEGGHNFDELPTYNQTATVTTQDGQTTGEVSAFVYSGQEEAVPDQAAPDALPADRMLPNYSSDEPVKDDERDGQVGST